MFEHRPEVTVLPNLLYRVITDLLVGLYLLAENTHILVEAHREPVCQHSFASASETQADLPLQPSSSTLSLVSE